MFINWGCSSHCSVVFILLDFYHLLRAEIKHQMKIRHEECLWIDIKLLEKVLVALVIWGRTIQKDFLLIKIGSSRGWFGLLTIFSSGEGRTESSFLQSWDSQRCTTTLNGWHDAYLNDYLNAYLNDAYLK